MSGEITDMRSDGQYMLLAERADYLLGRILDAKMEHLYEFSPDVGPKRHKETGELMHPVFEKGYESEEVTYCEGQPAQLEPSPKRISPTARFIPVTPGEELRQFDEQALFASYLFKLALAKATGTKPPVLAETMGYEEARPQPVRRKKPAKKDEPKRFYATTRTKEEIEAYTQKTINEMSLLINGPTEPDEIAEQQVNKVAGERREFRAGKTVIHVKNGQQELKKRARNHHIIARDEVDQVVIWVAQADGPRQAVHRPDAEARTTFARHMINMGRLNENGEADMDEASFQERLQEAVDLGLLTDVEDPYITDGGFSHIQDVLARDKRTDKNRAVFKPTARV